jgi:hypothetical protein
MGIALLAGCGANNVVTAGPTANPTPSPTPSPTPTPPPNGRSGLVGTTANYTGTLTETDTNNVIGSSPVSTTSTAQVTSAVKTSTDGSGNTVFTNSETDAAQLKTTSASIVATVAFQSVPAGTNVRTLSTVETDSTGAIFETDFGKNNGLVDVLPETDGATFANDGGLTYKETDPGVTAGAVTTTRLQNPDGSYAMTTNTIDSYGNPRTNTATQAVDKSGAYFIQALAVMSGGNVTSLGRAFTFAAPVGAAPPQIAYNNLTAAGAVGTARVQTQPGVNWLANATSLVSETDTITANQKLDTSCAPAAAFAGTATLVKQVVTTVDVVLGSIETRTTSSYDQFVPGTICAVVSDSIQNFYDYSEQEGNIRLFPAQTATPVATVTVNETLSLQSVKPPSTGSSAARSTSSLAAGFVLPHSLVASRVEHVVHQQALRRLLALRSAGGNK